MQKSLDLKLANIRANPGSATDFILADAKDADMAAGLAATGKDAVTGKPRSLAEYREQMRAVIKQGLVDIVLMSASTSEQLTIREKLFENSRITPAVRANDTTDIHLMTGSTFGTEPSRPFRTATIEQMQSGRINPTDAERKLGADLGLYSITPNNRIEFDYATVEAYRQFRIEAEMKGFRHFLEVFDPNACGAACPADLGRYINDLIARTLAGVPSSGRPVFLKIPYHGPRAMEELVFYDPQLVVGVLGGSSGTTYDAFRLLEDAKKYGARAALFGRKINNSEHQLTFVSYLRAIADGRIKSDEAVRAYHSDLQKLGIKPYRPLKEDSELTINVSSYSGSAVVVPAKVPAATPAAFDEKSPNPSIRDAAPKPANRVAPVSTKVEPKSTAAPIPTGLPLTATGAPDFKKMSAAQKVAYARQRIQNDLSRARQ